MAKKYKPVATNPPAALQLFIFPASYEAFRTQQPPKFWDALCNEAESAGSVTMSPKLRTALYRAFRAYIQQALFELLLPDAKVARSKFRSLATRSRALLKVMGALKDENPYTSVPVILSKMRYPRQFHRTTVALKSIAHACDEALAEFDTYVEGSVGRPKHPGLDELVNRLARIYSLSGGQPSGAWSENRPKGSERSTPFLRFSWSIVSRSPSEIRRAKTLKAFGEVARRSLQRGFKDPVDWMP